MGTIVATLGKLFGWARAQQPAMPTRQPMPARHAGHPPARFAPSQRGRPLRVVHNGTSGRLVISGRMADVCAELERLAAMESAQALAPAR